MRSACGERANCVVALPAYPGGDYACRNRAGRMVHRRRRCSTNKLHARSPANRSRFPAIAGRFRLTAPRTFAHEFRAVRFTSCARNSATVSMRGRNRRFPMSVNQGLRRLRPVAQCGTGVDHAASPTVTVTRFPSRRSARSIVAALVPCSGFNMRRTSPSATSRSRASWRCEIPAWRHAS